MNDYLIKILLVILLLFLINPLIAQESRISISSTVDKNVITIGDLIHYKVSVTHDKGIKVEYPGQIRGAIKEGLARVKAGQSAVLDIKLQMPENKPLAKVFS